MDHVTEVATLKEGEWSCYERLSLQWREKGRQRWSVLHGGRISLKKGEWFML